jgi:hypothetical protein
VKKIVVLIAAAALMFAVAGCGKKEEAAKTSTPPPGMGQQGQGTPQMPPPGMGQQGQGTPQMPPPGMGQGGMGGGMGQGGMGGGMGAAAKQVVVPDSVKKNWPAVKILVKKLNAKDDGKVFEVKAGQKIDVPGSSLKVEVGQYLPDFFMDGASITSKSDVQINPTVRMTIFDGDKQIYQGWAFEKYPEAHAFTHPEYSITLAGGVKAK